MNKPEILKTMETGLAAVQANGGKAKTYLCIADGERFTIEAAGPKEAQEGATIYNGQVIREIRDRKPKVDELLRLTNKKTGHVNTMRRSQLRTLEKKWNRKAEDFYTVEVLKDQEAGK